MGQRFKGVYNLYEKKLVLFHSHGKQEEEDNIVFEDLASPELGKTYRRSAQHANLRSEVEVIETVYPEFKKEDYQSWENMPDLFWFRGQQFRGKRNARLFCRNCPNTVAAVC